MPSGKKGFQKGIVTNPGGRPKGSQNKDLEPIRAAFNKLIKRQLPSLEADLASLEPKDRLHFIEKFAEFCIPKMQRVEMKADINGEIVQTTYVIGDGVEIEI